ncbi:MAG: dUTP diphosphatase [Anaerovoracaceae bacterium]|nr:dUTP diphosphatase [Anaerovoracaceae bacterium]
MGDRVCVKFVSKSGRLPAYETAGSAGADLRAYLPDGDVILEPGERKLIPTGLFSQLPAGMEAQIRARSGLSIRHGICLINGVGTVDSDYRGEWNVALVNLGQEPFTISDGDRIAQVVFSRYEQPDFLQTEIIDETERGDGGFGHTGVK